MSDELADALADLLAERDIHRALAHFARLADTKKFDDLCEVFADDVTFDYGAGNDESGIASLRMLLSRHLGHCGGTQHLIGSVTIDVDGETAVSRAYVQARHQHTADVGGPVYVTNGEYTDRWERRAAGWRIVRRDASWSVITGDPAILDTT